VLEFIISADQSLWKMARRVMRITPLSHHFLVHAGLALCDSDKAQALANGVEAQFQPVDASLKR
jgi:hypothetical protein